MARVVTERRECLRKTCLENKMARVVTLGVGVPEEDVVGKQDGAGCNGAVAVYEEDMVGKQDGAGCNLRSGSP